MTLHRTILFPAFVGLAALCVPPSALHAVSAGKSFPAAVKRNLDEEARLIVNMLQNYHYSGRAFREIGNHEIMERFLTELDSDKFVFSQADFDTVFRRFDHTLKAVYIYKGDMQPAQEIYALLIDRSRSRFEWIEHRLAEPFDLSGGIAPEAGDDERSDDEESENRRWDRRLTNELIEAMLAGRDEPAARDYLVHFYRKVSGYGAGFDPYEVRALFLDSLIRSFDPRSGYFSADSTREFALEMAGAVTGIGIDVRKEEGRCIVDRVHPGGPADLNSDLQPGDELTALGNEGETLKPVASMRLREVTDRLRGATGSSVSLKYRRESGEPEQEITLARSRVTLISNRAFGAVHVLPAAAGGNHRRIGVIAFPTFYSSEEAGGSSVSADVAELLDQMTAGGIDALVIDLRGNPGGNMEEAVRLCGQFLHSGPAAYSRPQSGEIVPYPIKPAEHVYDGPLIVLTSPESASASELLSGSLQTYHRAFVLGAESTLGKGTVQSYIPLDQLQGKGPQHDWGTLRLTSAMFNLPDGRPIQQVGVLSDIVLPLVPAPGTKREIELEHSIPAAQIDVPPLEPQASGAKVLPGDEVAKTLVARVSADLEKLPEWALWRDEVFQYSRPKDSPPQSLSLDARREERTRWIAAGAELMNRRRELLNTVSYEINPVDLASTREAKQAHDERLRGLLGNRSPNPLARLPNGGIVVQTPHGHLRRLRWNSFGLYRYTGMAGELAEAFNSGAGTSLGRDEMGVILSELLLLEHPNDTSARTVFERNMPEGTSADSVQAGIDAMLASIIGIDPDLRAERWTLDIPLREAVRAAAAWANLESAKGAASPR